MKFDDCKKSIHQIINDHQNVGRVNLLFGPLRDWTVEFLTPVYDEKIRATFCIPESDYLFNRSKIDSGLGFFRSIHEGIEELEKEIKSLKEENLKSNQRIGSLLDLIEAIRNGK